MPCQPSATAAGLCAGTLSNGSSFPASAGLFGEPIGAAADRDGLVKQVMQRLAEHKATLVEDFPTADPEQFIAFLRHFGRPLDNYCAGSNSAAYTLHPHINAVRHTPPTTRPPATPTSCARDR